MEAEISTAITLANDQKKAAVDSFHADLIRQIGALKFNLALVGSHTSLKVEVITHAAKLTPEEKGNILDKVRREVETTTSNESNEDRIFNALECVYSDFQADINAEGLQE